MTAIIYRDDGKYLITKRSDSKKVHPGRWVVPGGGLEVSDYINEKPTTADGSQWYGVLERGLRREIMEETGIEITDINFLCDLTFIRPDGIPVLCLSYYAKYVSGEVKIGIDEDVVDFAWVTLEEAKNYDLIDGIWEEISDTDKILKV